MATFDFNIYSVDFVNLVIKTALLNTSTCRIFQIIAWYLVTLSVYICLRLADYFSNNMELSLFFIIIITVFCTSFNLFRVSFFTFNIFTYYLQLTFYSSFVMANMIRNKKKRLLKIQVPDFANMMELINRKWRNISYLRYFLLF